MFPNPIKKIGTFHGLRPIECPGDDYKFAYINGNGIKNKINRLLPPCMADMLDLCVRKTLLDFVGLLCY